MIGPSDVLLGGLLPLAVAAAAMVAVSRLAGSVRLGWLTGFAVGYIAGQVGLDCRTIALADALSKLTTPHDARDWLPLAVAAAMVIGVFAHLAKSRRWVELTLAAPLSGLLPWRLLNGGKYLPSQDLVEAGFATDAWSTGQAAVYLGGFAVALWALWAAWATADATDAPRIRASVAVITAVLTSAVLALSGAIIYGQIMGVAGAALAGCGLGGMLSKEPAGPEGSAGPACIAVGGLLMLATTLSSLSPWRAAAIAVTWVVAGGSLPGAARRRFGSKLLAALRIAICVIPLAILVAWTAWEFVERERQEQESANPYEQYL